MTPCGLLVRSLRHYWRWHAGLALAVALAAAVIADAPAVGDSLGNTRPVGCRKARPYSHRRGRARTSSLGCSPRMLRAKSGPRCGSGHRRDQRPFPPVGGVNVIGVTDEFWRLALDPAPPPPAFAESGVGVNGHWSRRSATRALASLSSFARKSQVSCPRMPRCQAKRIRLPPFEPRL